MTKLYKYEPISYSILLYPQNFCYLCRNEWASYNIQFYTMGLIVCVFVFFLLQTKRVLGMYVISGEKHSVERNKWNI